MKEKLSDAEYIEQLERLVCFLCESYIACKVEYRDKHLQTCSITNENRRDLTESELEEIMRFPLIQDSRVGFAIERLAKIKIERYIDLLSIEERINQKT